MKQQWKTELKPSIINDIKNTIETQLAFRYRINGFKIDLTLDEETKCYLITGYKPPVMYNNTIEITKLEWHYQYINDTDLDNLTDKVMDFIYALEHKG